MILAPLKIKLMSRNTDKNIKIHNEKLHKARKKVKDNAISLKEKRKEIVKKSKENNSSDTR